MTAPATEKRNPFARSAEDRLTRVQGLLERLIAKNREEMRLVHDKGIDCTRDTTAVPHLIAYRRYARHIHDLDHVLALIDDDYFSLSKGVRENDD